MPKDKGKGKTDSGSSAQASTSAAAEASSSAAQATPEAFYGDYFNNITIYQGKKRDDFLRGGTLFMIHSPTNLWCKLGVAMINMDDKEKDREWEVVEFHDSEHCTCPVQNWGEWIEGFESPGAVELLLDPSPCLKNRNEKRRYQHSFEKQKRLDKLSAHSDEWVEALTALYTMKDALGLPMPQQGWPKVKLEIREDGEGGYKFVIDPELLKAHGRNLPRGTDSYEWL